MATVVLATAGQVIGTALGGPIGGAIGKAVGSSVGGRIDHKLFGPGPQRVEGPRLESLDVMTAQEGVAMPALDGRAAIAGQVIWSTRLEEVATTETHGGGKGGSPQPETEVTSYSYYASFAVAVCEGPVAAWGRVWADGKLLDPSLLGAGSKTSISNMVRFYKGHEWQQPDPLIVAKEGAAPAYRGIAYIVFERFPLGDYGNRIPQIRVEAWGGSGEMEKLIRGVDLIPGSTEWGYMPTPVRKVQKSLFGKTVGEQSENCHRYAKRADLMVSLDNLNGTLPNADTVALVVAWFIVKSNHDEHLDRWVRDGDFKRDPVNAGFYISAAAAKFEAIREGRDDFDLLEWALSRTGHVPVVTWLARDQSYQVAGVEMGLHGDLGPNGSRGSAAGLSRIGAKANIGHSHAAAIFAGCYQAGVSCALDMGYNRGPSNWSHSHILTYENGKRAIITHRGKKWRVKGDYHV